MSTAFRRLIVAAVVCALSVSASLASESVQALSEGAEQVMQKMKDSGLQGSGVGVEPIPGTDSEAVVSYGSAPVKQNADGTVEPQNKLIAKRASQTQADAAMASYLAGDGNGKASVPPGVNSSSWTDENGTQVSANVYVPELSEKLKADDSVADVSGAAAVAEFENADLSADFYEELSGIKFDEGMVSRVDWEKGFVEISGEGAAPAGKSLAQGRLLARRAATADMQRKYVEFLKGAVVQSATRMNDFEVQTDKVSSEVSGIARDIPVVDEKWERGIYTVTGRMQLKDVQKFLRDMRKFVKQ
ncbi:MAG: hypothetical protein SOZ52_02720 [Pyramidobacter sp.]|nr:hypothetical protein [Pyramidobacter sp.]